MILPYRNRRHREHIPDAFALDARDVSVGYSGMPQGALHHIDLCIPAGKRVALVGPNGAGKSTLLKAIAGLMPISSGSISVFGHPVGSSPQCIAYLPQRGEIDWRFPISLRRLALTGRYVHLGWLRRPSRADWAIVDHVIERLGLSELAERQIGQLSGGQQQRALLARALSQEADLLLLDEPLNAVDAEAREIISDILVQLRQQDKTVLVATHDLGRLESDFDGALYLSEGHQIPPPPGAFNGLNVGS